MKSRSSPEQQAREHQSQIHRRLARFPHHQFSHGEGVREGRFMRPMTEAEEHDPAIIAESAEFYALVIEWARAGERYAQLRAGSSVDATQAALAPRSDDEADDIEDF